MVTLPRPVCPPNFVSVARNKQVTSSTILVLIKEETSKGLISPLVLVASNMSYKLLPKEVELIILSVLIYHITSSYKTKSLLIVKISICDRS